MGELPDPQFPAPAARLDGAALRELLEACGEAIERPATQASQWLAVFPDPATLELGVSHVGALADLYRRSWRAHHALKWRLLQRIAENPAVAPHLLEYLLRRLTEWDSAGMIAAQTGETRDAAVAALVACCRHPGAGADLWRCCLDLHVLGCSAIWDAISARPAALADASITALLTHRALPSNDAWTDDPAWRRLAARILTLAPAGKASELVTHLAHIGVRDLDGFAREVARIRGDGPGSSLPQARLESWLMSDKPWIRELGLYVVGHRAEGGPAAVRGEGARSRCGWSGVREG